MELLQGAAVHLLCFQEDFLHWVGPHCTKVMVTASAGKLQSSQMLLYSLNANLSSKVSVCFVSIRLMFIHVNP